jgi:hypothetical protein
MHVRRAIAQEVIRRLLTAAARVRAQVRSCGICGGQSGAEAGFLGVLRFPPASSHSMEVSDQLHVSAGLHPGKDPPVPIG